MGQIIFNGQKPKYCNLTAITTGSKMDYVIPAGEVWLIDSTNASKTDGTGKYDKYIVGDGSTAAKGLTIHSIDDGSSAEFITKAQLEEIELTIAAALNDLHSRISSLEEFLN